MSAIAGIIRFDGAPVESRLIEAMTAALSRRGPDGIHSWVKGSVALGQCMLRTTPESLEEEQPLTNEDDSLVLVMDGRVDNWEELRQELLGRGAHLRSRADAELVLRSYETWGEDCLAHIDGDFALVIWDARRRTAFCARDRFGARQFFYHGGNECLAFCTEARPILGLPWVLRAINPAMLAEYLAGEFHSNTETLWRGLMRLPASHRMVVDASGRREDAYWEPDLARQLDFASESEWFETYRGVFFDSVRRLSRCVGHLSCEVSGGLDSSAVFCALHYLQRRGAIALRSINGLTLAFDGDGPANEVAYARDVGLHLGVDVLEIPPACRSLSWYARRGREALSFPGYPNGVMSIDLFRRAAETGSRVLLNGIGGDEWLGGSRHYYAEEIAARDWRGLLRSVRADSDAHGASQAASWLMRQGTFPLLPSGWQRRVRRIRRGAAGKRGDGSDCYWLAPEMRKYIAERRAQEEVAAQKDVERAGQRVLLAYLRDAHHHHATEMTEQFCAEHGLEVRRPLYTQDMVRFAFRSPERMRLRGDRNKYMHISALRSIMPTRVLERRSKAEFSVVFDEHLRQMADYFRDAVPERRPDWVSAAGSRELIDRHVGRGVGVWAGWPLWGVFGCDTVISGGIDSP